MNISSLMLMRFEWILTLFILVLIILRLVERDDKKWRIQPIAISLLLLNLFVGFLPLDTDKIFDGFFVNNPLIHLQKNILNFALLLIALSASNWIEQAQNRFEFYILLLTSMLGVFLMLSSGHVLPLYIGLEMSTIPLAALANFETQRKQSAEAGLKLILLSAFSTGILLYGISLLYGSIGDLHFDAIRNGLTLTPLNILAFVFILSGFAFKMSAVPFHLWTADVYEGAPVAVTNYLAVISKSSVVFVMFNVLYYLFGTLSNVWLISISILSALSMTIGNLFALRQQNIKRLLAFSSISQVGYMLVAFVGMSSHSVASVHYFVLIYALSNIAAFAVVGAIEKSTSQADLNAFSGLYLQNKKYAIYMAIALFSLAGIPPTAGFFGKLFLFTAGINEHLYWLLVIAAINLVLSLYNYLRVVKIMFIDKVSITFSIAKNKFVDISLVVCVIGIIILAYYSTLYNWVISLGNVYF